MLEGAGGLVVGKFFCQVFKLLRLSRVRCKVVWSGCAGSLRVKLSVRGLVKKTF